MNTNEALLNGALLAQRAAATQRNREEAFNQDAGQEERGLPSPDSAALRNIKKKQEEFLYEANTVLSSFC